MVVLVLALVYDGMGFKSRMAKLESRTTPVDPRINVLEFQVDELKALIRAMTQEPDTFKLKEAPPLRYAPAGPRTMALQYWTEKDGWQFIPKQTHP